MTEKKIVQNVRNLNEIFIVEMSGSLDVALQKELREDLSRAVSPGNDSVLDFSGVSFIDSSCLGALVSLLKGIREAGGDFKLANLADDVRSIFQITRLERVFEIFDTVEEAAESYYK